MTDPKKPLPSLRFVIYTRLQIFQLIPQTTPKGRVIPDVWAVPGDRLMHTNELKERCRANNWRWEITGDDGTARGARYV